MGFVPQLAPSRFSSESNPRRLRAVSYHRTQHALEYGRKKQKWLSQFLDLSAGIPSHDCFNAILGALQPGKFEACLLSWITALHEITDGQIVAIDGKTLRRSFDAASSKSAIHMVSAWATANCISLGQRSGCLVTIDAMGCQTEIAQKIIAADADYVLAVKGNQPTLHDGIVKFFLDHLEDDFAREGQALPDPGSRPRARRDTRLLRVRGARRLA